MSAEPLAEKLRTGLAALTGEAPDPARERLLLAYLALLERWNGAYNLTAVKSPVQMVTRHLLDSLSVLPWLHGHRLLDAGTGAGLPGVPLAIMRPSMEISLLDSSGKKIRFLNHVRRELGLQNVITIQQRLELSTTEVPYHTVISRAFSDLGSFAQAARHLASASTRFLAMKGKYPGNELASLPAWCEVCSVEKLEVPGLQEQRHLVIMSITA